MLETRTSAAALSGGGGGGGGGGGSTEPVVRKPDEEEDGCDAEVGEGWACRCARNSGAREERSTAN